MGIPVKQKSYIRLVIRGVTTKSDYQPAPICLSACAVHTLPANAFVKIEFSAKILTHLISSRFEYREKMLSLDHLPCGGASTADQTIRAADHRTRPPTKHRLDVCRNEERVGLWMPREHERMNHIVCLPVCFRQWYRVHDDGDSVCVCVYVFFINSLRCLDVSRAPPY